MRRVLAAAALSVVFTGCAALTSSPDAGARLAPQASGCEGVWVVVDYGSLGGTSTQCATSFGTGIAALRSAGFNPSISEGFVEKINGKPSKPDSSKAYWSYWHATRNDDGSYGAWNYSNLGASGYQPTKGNAEGWRFQSLGDGKVPPGAKPPTDAATPTPKPTPTKSTSKPTPRPSATRTPTATRKPSATRKPFATTTPSATASATPTSSKTSASAKATAQARASTGSAPPAAATAKASSPAPQESSESTSVALAPVQNQAAPPTEPGSGTPVGLILTAGLVVVTGAGLGGWWWLRGRKP